MAIEIGDKKKLVFVGALVVMLGLAGYVWYPRLFEKKPPVRARGQEPPLLLVEEPKPPAAPTAQAPGAAKPKAPGKPAPQTVTATPPLAAEPKKAPAPARAKAPEPMKQVAKAPAAGPAPEAKAPRSEATQEVTSATGRYGLEFPPFVTVAEAEEYEKKLKEAGLPTLRTTTDLDGGLYALVVGPLPSAAKASEVVGELRAKAGTSPTAAEGGFVVTDGPYVLREVVQRAIEARGKGYRVRIVPAEGKAPLYVIRTAAKLANAQAAKLSSHYREKGFPNSVVTSR